MQHADFQHLKEISWRRSLSSVEAARMRQFLADHPELQAQWNQEAALDRFLHRLPAAHVSSNFTARVVQAAQRAPVRQGWRFWRLPSRAVWLRRFALGVAMLCVGFLSFHGYQMTQRAHAARELANVSRLAALPPMAWLKDFDTIERLNKVQVADDELLAALQ
jgi:anti-sigma factor RsiW